MFLRVVPFLYLPFSTTYLRKIMKKMQVIGLTGNRKSGKDTIADLLVENWGYQKLELADLAKDILCKKVGIKKEELKVRRTKEFYRQQIIDIAEKLKELDVNFHCKVIRNQMLDLIEVGRTNFVLVGVRFPYEATFFRQYENVRFQSIYIESDLSKPHPEIYSESYVHSYFKKNNDGVIINNRKEVYDRNNESLINQLVKFVN